MGVMSTNPNENSPWTPKPPQGDDDATRVQPPVSDSGTPQPQASAPEPTSDPYQPGSQYPYTPPGQPQYPSSGPSASYPGQSYGQQSYGQPAGQYPSGGYGQAPNASPSPAAGATNSISALWDFGFTRFATPSLVKIAYMLAVASAAFVWLGIALLFFVGGNSAYGNSTAGLGIVWLLFGWIPAALELILFRMICEFFVVNIRTNERLNQIGESLKGQQ